MQEFYLDIDENVPLPSKAASAMPDLSTEEELNMRARTVKLLADMQGQAIAPDEDDTARAKELAKQMVVDPKSRPDFSIYPNETVAFLAGLVAQYNCMIVKDLADLKLYVVNKLVSEVENGKNAKDRISALKSLGEVDGVDAFKKRSEVTHSVKPIEEVETELLSILENVQYQVISEHSRPLTASEAAGDFNPEVEAVEEVSDDAADNYPHDEVYGDE